MLRVRSVAALCFAALVAGGCQLVSGLNGLHAGTGGAGGAGATGGTGGVTSSSSASSSTGGGTGGDGTTSSASSSSSASSASSSSGGCNSQTQQDCCGVDCGGGMCMNGVCRAYPLFPAGNEGAKTNVVVDQGHLYWGAVDSVRTGPATGGTVSALVSPGSGIQPTSVAVASGNVYWTDNVDMHVLWTQVPAPMSIGVLPAAATTSANSTMLAVNGWLVWNDPAKDTIFFASLPDGKSTLLAATNMASSPFAADDEFVYWDDGVQLWRHPLVSSANFAELLGNSDGAKILFASPGPAANGSLFWARSTSSGSDIRRANKDGSSAIPLASTSARVASLIADQNRIYWTESDCLSASSLATVHTTTIASPMDMQLLLETVTGCPQLAQDANAIYWATGNGTIDRLVKPLP